MREAATAETRIGTMDWLRQTQGNLSLRSRLKLLRQVLAPAMRSFGKSQLGLGVQAVLSLERVPLPDSSAVKHALDELESCADAQVIQHSFRTYFWGAGFAELGGMAYDPEFLLVGCLLHDLGMTPKHNGHYAGCQCFAGDSALAAAKTMGAAGWGEEKTGPLADMICLHMNGHITPEDGNEAHLLQQGAACDVVGSRLHDFHPQYRQAVLARHPRVGLNDYFRDFIAREAKARPGSRTALMQQVGLPLMIRMNPFAE